MRYKYLRHERSRNLWLFYLDYTEHESQLRAIQPSIKEPVDITYI